MPAPILNLADAAFDDIEDNGRYTSRRATIGDRIGARLAVPRAKRGA